MSLGTLVKQFKALTPGEQHKFRRAVARISISGPGHAKAVPQRQVHWPDVATRAAAITGGRVLPNLVLLEREESVF